VLGAAWQLGPPAAGDLGSGLAALLEVARVLTADAAYTPDYSVIVVAMDKEAEEREGSRAFIEQYLLPEVVDRFKCSIQGFINLDTIFSYSDKKLSQSLPAVFARDNRETVKQLRQGGSKGDFLSLISRGVKEEARLVEALSRHLGRQGVRVKHFQFPRLAQPAETVPDLGSYKDVWNSTSGRFWFEPAGGGLPAVTVSDLGRWRSGAGSCSIATCSTAQIRRVFGVRTHFLAAATRAVVDTVRELTVVPQVVVRDASEEKHQLRLYNMLGSFLSSLTAWQSRIEGRLAGLAAQSGLRANGSYVVLGADSVQMPVLKNVIYDYYRDAGASGRPENSPMIIKLVT
jgi:Zn-dependent M28 family amino/carboxypeptidase